MIPIDRAVQRISGPGGDFELSFHMFTHLYGASKKTKKGTHFSTPGPYLRAGPPYKIPSPGGFPPLSPPLSTGLLTHVRFK